VLAHLKKSSSTEDEYHRIGIARFIWTPSQREADYKGRKPGEPTPEDRRGITCHGPTTDRDARVTVRIV
jgi:hypothetical protein